MCVCIYIEPTQIIQDNLSISRVPTYQICGAPFIMKDQVFAGSRGQNVSIFED